MSDYSVRLANLGKKYRLYRKPSDKVLDALGLGFALKSRRQDFWALRDLSLTIHKGERVGIIGRNGAGKSTLLKIISGTTRATEGTASVCGTIQALMELGTGFHPEFTGKENIRAALAYQGLSARTIEEKLEEIVDFSELDEFINQPVRTYSAGMYARLAFATATSVEPDLLIIDESLGAGDAYFAGKCLERMRTLTESSGATVLFVSHDLSSVQRLCPRTIWIERGRVRRDGESMEVIKEYSAVVREEDELRLRARDMKIRKKHAGTLEAQEDIYHELLFHLAPVDGQPLKTKARIYGIRLLHGETEIAHIAVGGPMDNSPEFANGLLTETGFMDWGSAEMDTRGPYRAYGDFGGRYGHAPFKLAVPRTFNLTHGQWRLDVDVATEEPVAVEIFNGEGYRRVGVLKPNETCASLPLILASAAVQTDAAPSIQAMPPPPQPVKPQDEYGTMEARITAVRMYDAQGKESRTFEMGQPVRIEMDYTAAKPLTNPVFVFCAYLPDGQCASQWGIASREIGREVVQGNGRAVFRLPRLHLGRSAYVASAAIFKRLRGDGLEAESYHVLDRCIHFTVIQSDRDAMSHGLCLQPFEAELSDG